MTATRTTLPQRIGAAIREAYPMPERIAFLKATATHDLWHGPVSSNPESIYNPDPENITPETWQGFDAACAELRAWFDDALPSTLYWDDDCGVLMTEEPQPWTDDDGETYEPSEYYAIESREILAYVFPRKLAEYV